MPLRPMGREQMWMLTPTLDELLPLDHPARFVAEFVDALGRDAWAELGVDIEGDSMGAPAYHPRALLSVWRCRRQDRSSSKTRITRTDSPMTSVATALRVHRDRCSRSSVYSMRTESRCDCTGLPAPSARRARPPESVQGRRRLGEVWP